MPGTTMKARNFFVMYHDHFDLSREEVRSFKLSFSQFGEDIIIDRFFRRAGVTKGAYLDIGAYDPFNFPTRYFCIRKVGKGST